MKVSFVINEPVQNATGGYKMVYMYANSLVERGHKVTIYYLCRDGDLFTNYKAPFDFKFLVASCIAKAGPKWFKLNKMVARKAIKDINENTLNDANIIIATAVNTAIPVKNLSLNKGEKAYFIQGFENWEYDDEYVFKTYSLGMRNIVVAKWLKNIVDQYSVSESILLPNGIDTSIFFDKEEKRKKHSIVFQYRKMTCKGAKYALEAIRELEKMYSDLYVAVISTDDKPSDLPSCCDFFQCISPLQVAEINNKSEIFMCTSVEEGYGLPGLEAMACGCAVCSSSYKGVHEYAVNGVNALLSPVKDVKSMVANISSIFENALLKEKLKKNGVATAKSKSQLIMSNMFISVLNDMLENKNNDNGEENKW